MSTSISLTPYTSYLLLKMLAKANHLVQSGTTKSLHQPALSLKRWHWAEAYMKWEWTMNFWGKAYQAEGTENAKTTNSGPLDVFEGLPESQYPARSLEWSVQRGARWEMRWERERRLEYVWPCRPLWEFWVLFQIRSRAIGEFCAGVWHDLI